MLPSLALIVVGAKPGARLSDDALARLADGPSGVVGFEARLLLVWARSTSTVQGAVVLCSFGSGSRVRWEGAAI